MKHRFCVSTPIVVGEPIELAGDEFHHAAHVARVREGEEIELFDGRGAAATGRIESIERDHLVVRVISPVASREPRIAITLAMAIIQLDRFELVLQKATELGVAAIVPLVTDRVEIRPERYRGKLERWNRIVFEAVKQCGRAAIPRIATPSSFADVIAGGGAKIVFDADAEVDSIDSSFDRVTLFIGPEGGWSENELALTRRQGCAFQRLGPRRLRAETAAIVAAAIMAWRSGDLA